MESRLGPQERAAAVAELSSVEVDVLVVGGGVVGAGAALDAVTRGLSVGLIEQGDWGSGSSSRSSLLINGGLGHINTLELGQTLEGLRERSLLFDRVAPHLVRRVPFLFPLRYHGWDRARLGAALALYDAMGHSLAPVRWLPSHRHLSARSVRRIAPGLRPDLTGAVQYYGAEVDDARYVITLVRTAVAYGALVASGVRAEGLIIEEGRVQGVRVSDVATGRTAELRAKVVVAATGRWVDEFAELVPPSDRATARLPVVTTKRGVHLVVPRDRIRSSTGVIARTPSSVLLVIPWGRHWIIGSDPAALEEGPPVQSAPDAEPTRPWGPAKEADEQPPTSMEIETLLAELNTVLAIQLTQADVESSYAGSWPQVTPTRTFGGYRPPAQPGEHAVTAPLAGLVLVAGGSFSRYRLIAKDAIDTAARSIGGLIAESITDQVPLVGADGYQARWNQRHLLARRAGLHVARVEHLLNRYGSLIDQLLELVAEHPELRTPLPGAEDYLAVELVYAVTHEGATGVDDLLARRTRIAMETRDRGLAAASAAAELAAGHLGWDETETNRQIREYVRQVNVQRVAESARPSQRLAGLISPLDRFSA